MQSIPSAVADNTKLGAVTDTPEGYAAIQRDLDRLEQWAENSWKSISTRRCTKLESRFAEEDLGVLVVSK